MKKNIYIVLSHTGTFPAKVIRWITHGKYSHVSLCLEDDFKVLYSFGRIHPYNPFHGGYVKESPDFGTFKRFRNTEVRILRIRAEESCYDAMKSYLEKMYEERDHYKYNYRGLFLAIFNKQFRRKDHFFCSEFVSETLDRFRVVDEPFFDKLVKPMDLFSLPDSDVIYTGKFSVFSESGNS